MIEQREACKIIKKHFEGKDVVGAEVGVCYGDHAESLLYNIPNLHLHLIDDASEYETKVYGALGRELKNIPNNRYTWHLNSSIGAAKDFGDNSLDFVYIDAKHDAGSVLQDCGVWYPKIKKGGIICGHDYDTTMGSEVPQAVDEFFKRFDKTVHSGANNDDSIAFLKNISDWWVYA